jgi:hypothetical protein
VPAKLLAALDGLFQPTGKFFQFTPSVFVKAKVKDNTQNEDIASNVINLFKCPDCEGEKLENKQDHLHCTICESNWAVQNGIYDFRERMK